MRRGRERLKLPLRGGKDACDAVPECISTMTNAPLSPCCHRTPECWFAEVGRRVLLHMADAGNATPPESNSLVLGGLACGTVVVPGSVVSAVEGGDRGAGAGGGSNSS